MFSDYKNSNRKICPKYKLFNFSFNTDPHSNTTSNSYTNHNNYSDRNTICNTTRYCNSDTN